jgi:hypothetical protein
MFRRYLAMTLCLSAVVLLSILYLPVPPPGTDGIDSECPHAVSQVAGDGLPPRRPNPWFHVERAFPQNEIPRDKWQEAQLKVRTMGEQTTHGRSGWTQMGPTNVGGRITDLAVDPTNSDIVYAGAADGGVLRTGNGGQTWVPLFDQGASLAIGAVALDPTNSSIVYAGTGEVNPGGGSVAYGGTGIYRSLNQGDDWECLGLENSGSIGRIVIDPTDPDRIFVAVMGHLWAGGPDRGVYRSINGGTTWDRILYLNETTGCVDLIIRPDNPQVLLAAMWQRLRQPEAYDYGGSGCSVYRSDNGGDSWSLVGGGLPTPSADGGRIGLSLCTAQPNVMVAIYADRVGYFDGLYRSTDGGFNWTRTSDGSLDYAFASYGWWFGNVRLHPVDPNTIFVLGYEYYRSTNGGGSYSHADGIMHVDHHAQAFSSGANPVIYNGNDGGVYRSTNGGTVWSKLPDLPITQIYRLAIDAGNPSALYGGAQDNSTVRTVTGNLDDWDVLYGGDGFQPLVHPTSSNKVWALYQYLGLGYSSNGGSSFSGATNGISGSDRMNWNAPHIFDPTDPETRYTGTQRVYRSTGNTSWTSISGDLTGGPHSGNSGQVQGTLTTLAVSPVDNAVIWTGSDDGHVNVYTGGIGGGWIDVSDGLPQRWITSVRSDPLERNTAYVTVSGFRWHEPMAHVYKTDDLGANWISISGNLPDMPVNEIVIDPDYPGRYYIATDLGVFATTNNGDFWSPLGNDLPNAAVTSMLLSPQRVLIAGTYGRSFFGYNVDNLSAVDDLPAVATSALGELMAPAPNPTRRTTSLSWRLESPAEVTLDIFTVSGRRIFTETQRSANSEGRFTWQGVTQDGRSAPGGVYLARARTAAGIIGSHTIILQ